MQTLDFWKSTANPRQNQLIMFGSNDNDNQGQQGSNDQGNQGGKTSFMYHVYLLTYTQEATAMVQETATSMITLHLEDTEEAMTTNLLITSRTEDTVALMTIVATTSPLVATEAEMTIPAREDKVGDTEEMIVPLLEDRVGDSEETTRAATISHPADMAEAMTISRAATISPPEALED